MTRILITICARGGSKGIPGKNIRSLNGVPLMHYTIGTARKFADEFPGVDIELSTDSDTIIKIAADTGLQTSYVRPDILATDSAGKIGAISDLWKFAEATRKVRYDYVIDMDVTSPLRTVADLRSALEKLIAQPEALNIFSVSPAGRNPYFNMVQEEADGRVGLVKKPEGVLMTRQSAPPVYDMNASFYIFRRSFFERGEISSITDYSLAFVMDHVCFDLDEPLDFEIMDFLLREEKLNFSL